MIRVNKIRNGTWGHHVQPDMMHQGKQVQYCGIVNILFELSHQEIPEKLRSQKFTK